MKKCPSNIRCPKCLFQWASKEIKWDYNPVFFWMLFFFFPIIWGVLYYHFTTKTKYICSECESEDIEFLEEKKEAKKTSPTTRTVWIIGAILMIWLVANSEISTQAPQKTDMRAEKLAEATANRLQTIIDLHSAESPEFVSAESSEDMIIITYSKQPKLQTADTIARGQAVNLSRERGQATWSPEFAIVRVKIWDKIVASCRANNAKIVSCH